MSDSIHLHIGQQPQLLVDNVVIECVQGLTRRWHKPEPLQESPVLQGDQPWEITPYFTYSNYLVLHDPADGRYKCWYEDLGPLDRPGHPRRTRLLYAESVDGRTFEKPALNICPVAGRPTNIVMGYAGPGAQPTAANPWADVGVHSNGVVLDPHCANPAERFRTIFSRWTPEPRRGGEGNSIACAHSADGRHWQPYDQPPTVGSSGHHLGDVSCLHYDEAARLFVQNTRHGRMFNTALPAGTPSVLSWFAPHYPHRFDLQNKRRVYQTRSHDFLHWSEPLLIATADDTHDNLDEAHYGMQQFQVGRMHFATLGIFRFVDNEMDVRLLYSRDGVHFTPADRGRPFLTPRGAGHWDRHLVSITSPPVTQGDEWWFYHGGANVHHDWWMAGKESIPEPEARDPAAHVRFGLGVVRLRREGFASLAGSRQRPGYLKTRPLMSDGTRLRINARCRPGGAVRVAVLDAQDQPVDGCTLDACADFTGDATAHEITWRDVTTIAGAGTWRKLHFDVRDAELYSFQFTT